MTEEKKKAKYSLEDVNVKEISIVSKPAIGRTYLLTKAVTPIDEITLVDSAVPAATDVDQDAGTVPADNRGVNVMNEKLLELLKSVESEETREALTGAFETILDNNEAVPDEVMKGFYELAGYEIPTIEKEVEVEKEVIKEVEKIVEVEKKADEDSEEEVLKGLTEGQLALFKEQKAKIAEAEAKEQEATEKAAAEEDARINQEYVQKATENWTELQFKSDELGPVLRAVTEKLDESESKIVMSVFERAKGATTLTKQDEEFGNAGGDSTVTKDTKDKPYKETKYDIRAKAMVEAKEAATIEQAMAKLYDEEPELFLGEE